MGELTLTKGFVALVDDADLEWLAQWRWCALDVNRNGRFIYAHRGTKRTADGVKTQKSIYLHRAIMEPAPGLVVDHINGNTLDCRRANMRVVSPSQNLANKTLPLGKSGFRGVTVSTSCKTKPFFARAGRGPVLGFYATAEEAARAYDAAALAQWGACARLNFPTSLD